MYDGHLRIVKSTLITAISFWILMFADKAEAQCDPNWLFPDSWTPVYNIKSLVDSLLLLLDLVGVMD